MSAENRQVGGDHYKKLGIQPMKFAMVNDWDCDAFQILRYLSRHHNKDGKKDIEKAIHCVDLRVEHISNINKSCTPVLERITMRDYIRATEFPLHTKQALFALESWVYSGSKEDLQNLKNWMRFVFSAY